MTGAILLAGGRASRVDGAAKPLFEVGGRTLLQRAVEAVAGCAPVTVAAAAMPGVDGVTWVREDPPFGGPAAAVVAVLQAWARGGVLDGAGPADADGGAGPAGLPEWTFVLACDVPGVEAAVARLRRDLPLLPADVEGLCLADGSSRPQWLTGVYRTAALRRAAAALPDAGRGAPMRALLDDLAIAVVTAPETETADVDTWEDLERARTLFAAEGERP